MANLRLHPPERVSQLRRCLLLFALLVPLIIPRHPQRHVLLWRGHVDLVVVADGIRRPPVLARHPPLDVGRLPADLVDIGVDYDGCACACVVRPIRNPSCQTAPCRTGFRYVLRRVAGKER